MYLRIKHELYRSMLSQVRALQTDRHTDRRDRTHYQLPRPNRGGSERSNTTLKSLQNFD